MAVIKPDETLSPLSLSDFKPQPKLVTRETQVARPRFPVIDAHNHLSLPGFGGWDTRPVAELLDHLDQADVGCTSILTVVGAKTFCTPIWIISKPRRRSASASLAASTGRNGRNSATASPIGRQDDCASKAARGA
ncbi:MAG: hypothetical protein IPK17_00020 [Chloroflexi bacterium]|uniref:hypothetical protein n=1 Tax=Candidatus Flexifilum breve TaxID=3140694 RepID=UPI0031374B76|nr:hypothetical protein [Chloroflexota bacterium]